MDNIKLKGNNGSVPDPYYHQFSLTFFEDGDSVLEIKIGRSPEERVIHQERKKKTPDEVLELIKEAQRLTKHHKDSVLVGGPEKIIEINRKGKANNVLTIHENTEEIKFFLKCVDSFSAGLRKRLADIL